MAPKRQSKRKDGKPDRAQRSEERKRGHAQARKELGNTFSPGQAKRPVGGQTEWTAERAEAVCALVSTGYTLRGACRELNLNESTVRRWYVDDREGFHAQYSRARELQAEAWADDLVEESDGAIDGVNVQSAGLRINTKKWLMGKNALRRFGDKVQVEGGDPTRPIRHVHDGMTAQEAAEAYAEAVRKNGDSD